MHLKSAPQRFRAVFRPGKGRQRGGWNVAIDAQVIIGAAVPVTWTGGETSVGVFGYFSYELPFKR